MNVKEEAIESLRRLLGTNLLLLNRISHHGNLDHIRDEGILEELELVITDCQKVVDTYGKEKRDKIEGYPYLSVDKIPGYRNTVTKEMIPGFKRSKK